MSQRGGDVVLRDGSTLHIRAMRSEDELVLFNLFRSLSDESRWLRFLGATKDSTLLAEARRETHLDYASTFGLIALSGSEERVAGHAFYTLIDEDRAEVAFTIANEFQGRGLG